MLVESNPAGDTCGLSLQTEQEVVQRPSLTWERGQEPRQAGLSAQLPQEADDDLVHSWVLTNIKKTRPLQL